MNYFYGRPQKDGVLEVVYRKGLKCSPHRLQGRRYSLLERQVLIPCPSSSRGM